MKIIKPMFALVAVLVVTLMAATSVSADQISKEPLPDISIYEDEPTLDRINLNDYFSNGNSQLHFSSIGADKKIDVTIHDDGSVDLIPPKDWYGTDKITFIASDGRQEASDTILVTVLAENDPPKLLEPISDVEFYEDSGLKGAIDLNEHFIDIDSTLTFSCLSDSILVEIGDDGVVDLSAPKDWYGTEEITLKVFDGEYEESDLVSVEVISVNDAPSHTVNSVSISLTQKTTERVLDLNQYFTDIDDEILDYELSGNKRVKCEINSEEGELILDAPNDWSGEELLTITARDTSGEDSSVQMVVVVSQVKDSSSQIFYLLGLILAVAITGFRLQMTGRGKTIKSPVKLSSYRYYKGE